MQTDGRAYSQDVYQRYFIASICKVARTWVDRTRHAMERSANRPALAIARLGPRISSSSTVPGRRGMRDHATVPCIGICNPATRRLGKLVSAPDAANFRQAGTRTNKPVFTLD